MGPFAERWEGVVEPEGQVFEAGGDAEEGGRGREGYQGEQRALRLLTYLQQYVAINPFQQNQHFVLFKDGFADWLVPLAIGDKVAKGAYSIAESALAAGDIRLGLPPHPEAQSKQSTPPLDAVADYYQRGTFFLASPRYSISSSAASEESGSDDDMRWGGGGIYVIMERLCSKISFIIIIILYLCYGVGR